MCSLCTLANWSYLHILFFRYSIFQHFVPKQKIFNHFLQHINLYCFYLGTYSFSDFFMAPLFIIKFIKMYGFGISINGLLHWYELLYIRIRFSIKN